MQNDCGKMVFIVFINPAGAANHLATIILPLIAFIRNDCF